VEIGVVWRSLGPFGVSGFSHLAVDCLFLLAWTALVYCIRGYLSFLVVGWFPGNLLYML